jgi:hypothetical protein
MAWYNKYMKTTDMETIVVIADEVKTAVKKFALTANSKVKGNTEDLGCYCAIASHALMTALKKSGINAKLVVGFFDENEEWDYNDDGNEQYEANHCWVEVDGYYIDITATQFIQHSDEEVVILEIDDADLYYPYTYPSNIKSMQSAKAGWGKQAPCNKYTKHILLLAQSNKILY